MTTQATLLVPEARAAVALRPYQEAAIEAFLAGAKRGLRRMLVVCPTGAGKSFYAISLARRMNARTLWLAHRDELIRQTLEAVGHAWPEAETGTIKAERDDFRGKQFVVASVQTLWRPDRIRRLGDQKFDLVVYDEVHHVCGDSNARLVEDLGCYREGGPLLLGLTATPSRTDKRSLDGIFEEVVYRVGLLDLIEQRYLSRFRSQQVVLDLRRENLTVSKDGDFDQDSLERELLRAGAAEATARAVADHARERRAVVFTVSVDQAERTAAELSKLGVRAEAVSYLTRADERGRILARFRAGETTVLANAFLLVEGVDIPQIDCVVMARPTKSQPLYLQGVGRGLRLYPGKADCLILDLVGASDLGLVTADKLVAGLEAERAGEARDPEGPSGEAVPEDHEDKRVHSYLAAATGSRSDSDVAWVEVERGSCWALGCGESGTLVLRLLTSPLEVRDPARKFLAQVASALAGGRAHARGISEDRRPWPRDNPERFGWLRVSNYKSGQGHYAARGPRIGWVEDEFLYLDLTATRAALRSTLPNPGAVLREAGLLVASQPGQANGAVQKTIAGKTERVHYLRVASLFEPPPEVAPGAPESWLAELLPRARDAETRSIGDPGALDWAFGLAEEHARALGALVLSRKKAGWRQQEATVGQKAELEKRRIPCHATWLTRGEAADLLTAASVRWRVLGKVAGK